MGADYAHVDDRQTEGRCWSHHTAPAEIGVRSAEATGKRVVFVDLDSQGTLRGWWEPPHRGRRRRSEPRAGNALSGESSRKLWMIWRPPGSILCVIDTPPSVHPFLGATIKHADLILLPTRPTTDDLDALPAVLDLIEDSGRPFAFVVTRAPAGPVAAL